MFVTGRPPGYGGCHEGFGTADDADWRARRQGGREHPRAPRVGEPLRPTAPRPLGRGLPPLRPRSERRVREVISLRDQGVSAAEASRRGARGRARRAATTARGSGQAPARRPARVPRRVGRLRAAAREPAQPSGAPGLRATPMLVAQLLDAVTALDKDRAHAVLDTAFVERSIESAIIDVLLRAGRRDAGAGPHRHRPGALRREQPGAPPAGGALHVGCRHRSVAVLACPPGEFHDIVLLSWGPARPRRLAPCQLPRPRHPDPLARLGGAAHPGGSWCSPAADPPGFRGHASALHPAQQGPPVWIAGRGATPRVIEEVVSGTSAVTSWAPSPSSPPRSTAPRTRPVRAVPVPTIGAKGGAEPSAVQPHAGPAPRPAPPGARPGHHPDRWG